MIALYPGAIRINGRQLACISKALIRPNSACMSQN
jgi:hypothetical protein